jgi:hypothetical protein
MGLRLVCLSPIHKVNAQVTYTLKVTLKTVAWSDYDAES